MLLLCYFALPFCFIPIAANEPQYEFVSNVDRLVGIDRADSTLIGKLDKDGEFTLVQRVVPNGGPGGKIFLGGGPAYVLLNVGELKPSKVFEFRSGMLIPGTMRVGGKFIPEPGEKVIRFSDYKYSPSATPIWNLPGGFVLKKTGSVEKK